MLSWDDFRYVQAVAEAKGLSGAADRLGVNHSTVFRRLGQIESRLGARLFDRHRAGYVATPAGEEMIRLAGKMGDDVLAFERRVTGRDLRPSGDLKVTTADTLLVHLMTDVFAAFTEACPDITLDVVVANEALNLSRRDADVAVRATDRPPETLIGRRVATIGWAVYGASGRVQGPFDMIDARRWRWIAPGDGLAGLKPARWLDEHVGEDRFVYRVNTVLGMAEAAAAGIGLALLPCFIGELTPGLVRLTPHQPEVASSLWLLTHPDLRQTARVRSFMDFAASEIGRRRALIEGNGDDPPRLAAAK